MEQKKFNLELMQIDSKIIVKVNNQYLPDIFSKFKFQSSNCSKSELWLCIEENFSAIDLLLANSKEQKK